ncbi:MAG: hypothetical protein ACTSRW_07790 [Candidatus Helarchaeota archaeon]
MPTKMVKTSDLYWMAKVGHGNLVAFYAVGRTLEEVHEKIEALARDHFVNLLELKGTWIKLVREFNLAELELNQNFLINVATGLKQEIQSSVPPKLLIPVEFTLLPLMDFEKTDDEIWDFVQSRNLLSKKEILYSVTGRTTNNVAAKLHEFKSGLVWGLKLEPRSASRYYDVETGKNVHPIIE